MAKRKTEEEAKTGLPFTRENYMLLAIGFLIIVLGFVLMVGGQSEDPNVFNPKIFNFRRITLAPIIVLFGFAFEIYAIMKRPRQSNNEEK